MATVVIMPRQGQSVETCAIVGWKKKVGEKVSLGEVICEVETDKATFEVEATAEGTLLAIFHEAGTNVPVLAPIAAIGKPGESVAGLDKAPPAEAAQAPAPPAQAPAPAAAAATSTAQAGGRPAASPRAKALAAARGIALDGIPGSGPGGRIIERDVAAAAGQPPHGVGAFARGRGRHRHRRQHGREPAATRRHRGHLRWRRPHRRQR